MPIALSPSPAYPLPGGRVSVRFSGAIGNYVRVWATEAPLGSAVRSRLDAAGSSRVKMHEADVRQAWVLQPDRGGRYTFVAQEYTRNEGYGGGYAGDPDGFDTETAVGAEVTAYVYVGEKVTFPIGTGEHESTLVLFVWNEHIRPTTVAIHDEVSPRIDPGPTPLAVNSAKASGVASALAALSNVTAASAIANPTTVLDDIITSINGHFVNTGTHAADDTDNGVDVAYMNASNPAALYVNTAAVMERWAAHMVNDARAGDGPGGATYHSGGSDREDTDNTLLAEPPRDMPSLLIALADLYRSYSAHHDNATYHAAVDGLNLASISGTILDVMRAFQVELADISPTVAGGQQTGVALLAGIGGTTE